MLTAEQTDLLLHMTGLDRSPTQTRDYFATSPGGRDHATLESLARLGLVRQCGGPQGLFGGDVFYRATEAGVGAAQAAAAPSEKGVSR